MDNGIAGLNVEKAAQMIDLSRHGGITHGKKKMPARYVAAFILSTLTSIRIK